MIECTWLLIANVVVACCLFLVLYAIHYFLTNKKSKNGKVDEH